MNLIHNKEIEELAIEMGAELLYDILNLHRLEFVSTINGGYSFIDKLFEDCEKSNSEICTITFKPNTLLYFYIVCQPKKLYDILYKSIHLKAFI